LQQGHTPAYYRDHPQDIRHRTVNSRKPPPLATRLMKADPDSATSPSKYIQGQGQDQGQGQSLPDVAAQATRAASFNQSTDSENESLPATRRKKPRKKKQIKQEQEQQEQQVQQRPRHLSETAGESARIVLSATTTNIDNKVKNSGSSDNRLINKDIQTFLHRSKSGAFNVEDVKHAMDTARIIGRSDDEDVSIRYIIERMAAFKKLRFDWRNPCF
jgi:hypothetical protein